MFFLQHITNNYIANSKIEQQSVDLSTYMRIYYTVCKPDIDVFSKKMVKILI